MSAEEQEKEAFTAAGSTATISSALHASKTRTTALEKEKDVSLCPQCVSGAFSPVL